MNIGDRIKQRREELGITVEEVAKRLGKHRATVYRYESNEIGTLPTSVLEPLAVVLHTTPAALMGWEEYKNTEEVKQLQRSSLPFEGMEVSLEKVFGAIEAKYVMDERGWQQPYWLVGKAPDTFVLYEPDIEALVKATEALLPSLVERMKDTRPEAEIIQEILAELKQVEPPKDF